VPAPLAPGKYPCLISNRGGHEDYSAIDETVLGSLAKLASEGWVIAASQYRGGPGSEGRDELGGGDVDDVLNLIPLLESEPKADPTRIGMLGSSRGGMMTYLVCFQAGGLPVRRGRMASRPPS